MADSLDSVLVERCPDLLVVLDAELRVVRASAGLRAAVPQVEPGMEFARSLDEVSRPRFDQAMALDRDAAQAFSLDLTHRGRDRLVPATYRFFALEGPLVAGLGHEMPVTNGLVDQVEALRRQLG